MPIHAYAAIDYEGIEVLNDVFGGVTVQVLEDLTFVNPALQEGKIVTLDGQHAHSYVWSRNIEELDSNNMRKTRQKQYMMAFVQKTVEATKVDVNVPLKLYQAASNYMVTNVSIAKVTYLVSKVLNIGIADVWTVSVPGEVVKGEIYAKFIPNEEKLYELILDIFYTKVNNS